MQKTLFLFLFLPVAVFTQTQIGQNIFPEVDNEHSGWSVSISSDGQTVASSAQPIEVDGNAFARARVYTFDGQDFIQKGQTLEIETFINSVHVVRGKVCLADNGNILAMSNPFYGSSEKDGITRIFEYNGTEWQQLGQDILGEDQELMGYSISLSADGMIAAILSSGSNNIPNTIHGSLTVFQYNGTEWVQMGQKLEGYSHSNIYYSFGLGAVSLSNDGSRMVVGTYTSYTDLADPRGEVRVYEFTGSSWELLGQPILNESIEYFFAWDVDISGDGNTIAVGNLSSSGPGMVKILELNGDQWELKGENIMGDQVADYFGNSVSLSDNGTIVAVGAPLANNSTSYFEGYAGIYKFNSTNWSQVGTAIYGNSEYDFSGFEVALAATGTILAVGTPNYTNEPYTDSGVVKVYGLSELLSVSDYDNNPVAVYPNPAQKTLQILLDDDVLLTEVAVYNSVGQLIKKEHKTTLDIAELASGTYYIQVVSNKGKHTAKFLKK